MIDLMDRNGSAYYIIDAPALSYLTLGDAEFAKMQIILRKIRLAIDEAMLLGMNWATIDLTSVSKQDAKQIKEYLQSKEYTLDGTRLSW